jgi:hypothetical protein
MAAPRPGRATSARPSIPRSPPWPPSSYEALQAQPEADYEDTGGVGGMLAGNPLSLAAMRATLSHVLTADAYAR